MTDNGGYIRIIGWEDFQHPDVKRRAAPGAAWIKCYVDLLDNPAYMDLAPTYRAVLHALWMATARMGQSRCSARADHVQRLCSLPAGWAQKSLVALSEAGFIEVVASRAQAVRLQYASPEVEGSKEPQKEKKSARAKRDAKNLPNGDQPHPAEDPPLTRAERQRIAREALAVISAQPAVKDIP
jgi:hypothetical protein